MILSEINCFILYKSVYFKDYAVKSLAHIIIGIITITLWHRLANDHNSFAKKEQTLCNEMFVCRM